MATGRIILELTAGLVTAGGLFDIFTPRLPSNLVRICAGNEGAQRLTRELLRALGGSLFAIGGSSEYLVVTAGPNFSPSTLLLVLLLIVPAELLNAIGMFRVGSPYYFPLAFVFLTVLGVTLSWPHHL